MVRKLTITVDEDVYEGLRARIGPRKISRFLNDLARPLVSTTYLEAGYQKMGQDELREREAKDWVDSFGEDAGSDD